MPDHWQDTTLEDSCDILDRLRQPISSAERAKRPGTIPYFGAAGQAGWIDEAIFDEPLVLLGEDAVDFASPTARKAYCIEGPSWVNNHAHVLRPGTKFVNSLMLELLLNAVDYTNYAVFGTRSKLTQAAMKSIRLCLPPLDEQRRIVDLVGSIDTYIESLETQVETTRTARAALLSELLSNPGDDWQETTLGEVAEASWGNTSVTKKAYVEAGYTAFSASGPDGCVEWFEHSTPGVVLSAIGALCGKTWFATGHWTPIKNTIWFRADSDELTQWLYLATSDPTVWPKRGQAQPFIALGDVRSLEIVIPPRAERSRQVDLVNAFSAQINALESQVESVRALRSGVLSELLAGERLLDESYVMAVAS